RTYAFIVADVDHFKSINDNYGHATGDQVLKVLADRLLKTVRAQDQVGRWGGEEFVVFVPETESDGALVLAEKLRSAIAGEDIRTDSGAIPVTITLGIAGGGKGSDITEVINAADDALYEGKRNGRNQAVYRDPTPELDAYEAEPRSNRRARGCPRGGAV
ncbi:MAG: diguanylate cyclase, partial [Spirochaetes bacterium]|nr:diguanylate cyclase [Spirochaetota bacterium]